MDTVTWGDFGHPELDRQTGTFRQDTAVEPASGEVSFRPGVIDPLITQSKLQSQVPKITHAPVLVLVLVL